MCAPRRARKGQFSERDKNQLNFNYIVVYRGFNEYRFAEGGVFPRFATPSFKSEARMLASVEPGGLQNGEMLSPSLKQYS